MARPRRTLRPNELETIKQMAAHGCRESDIATKLHMSLRTWRRIRDHDPVAHEVHTEARKQEEDALVGRLYTSCMKGDTKACIYLLNTRHGYRGFAAIPHEATPLGIMTAKPVNDEQSMTAEKFKTLNPHQQAVAFRQALEPGGAILDNE